MHFGSGWKGSEPVLQVSKRADRKKKKKKVTAEIHISADKEATARATAFPRSEIEERERERTQTNAGKSPVRKQSEIPAGRGAAEKNNTPTRTYAKTRVCKH